MIALQGNLKSLIESAEDFLGLPPAQLAGYLLIDCLRYSERFLAVELADFVGGLYSSQKAIAVKEAAMEALAWLMAEGLVIPDFHSTTTGSGWYRLGPTARKAVSNTDVLELIRLRQILPKAFLHVEITNHAVPIFMTGSYDTSVHEAFKQVEIVIRDATGLSNFFGVELVRVAFRPANPKDPKVTPGVLTDVNTLEAEQQGMTNLFAGAMAVFRNPSSHQNLATTSGEAGSLLTFASHLLFIAEKHIGIARQAGRIE